MIIFIKRIDTTDLDCLSELYKDVFSGFPWYEDLACRKCKQLYTRKDIKEESKNRVIKLENFNNCLKCNQKLELVSYYPEIVNQRKLITEAININGFIGYLAINNNLIGFSFGYRIPDKRTLSVNFPEINELLIKDNIDPLKSFYGSETGIVEEYQGKGFGNKLIQLRNTLAFRQGYKTFLNRTINPKIKSILIKLFSGKEPKQLFNDPETKSPWFMYDFKDLNTNDLKY